MDDDDCRETDNSEGEKLMSESHEIRIRLTKKLKRMLKYVGFHPSSVYITYLKYAPKAVCCEAAFASMRIWIQNFRPMRIRIRGFHD